MNRNVCITEYCNTILENKVQQTKYCDVCRVKRDKALYYIRSMRKEIDLYMEKNLNFKIKIRYSGKDLLLSAQHKEHDFISLHTTAFNFDVLQANMFIRSIFKYIENMEKRMLQHRGFYDND